MKYLFTMLMFRSATSIFLAAGILLVIFTGCHKESSNSSGPLQPLSLTYIAPDSAKVGDVIRINGNGFNTVVGGNAVDFNGVPGVVQTATFSTLQVKVPVGAVSGKVTVTVNNRTVTSSGVFKVLKQVGNNVDYITVLSGQAAFSKFTTLSQIPSFMYIDKVNNILYYTNSNTFNDGSTVYAVNLSTGKESKFSTDPQITNVKLITTDAAGKVYLVCTAPAGSLYNLLMVDPGGSTVTQLLSQVDLTNDIKSRIFYVGTNGTIYLANHSYTVSSGQAVAVANYKSLANALGAGVNQQNGFNYTTNDQFYTYNMLSGTSTNLNFSFSNFFGQDDRNLQAQNTYGNGKYNVAYATDNSNNIYGVYQHSYETGQLVNTYYLREYVNGTNTLLAKFTNSFSVSPQYIEPQTSNGGILIASDAAGNLYLRNNDKDIIKITHK